MSLTRPTNLTKVFATSGAKNSIPVATASPKASYTDGFPPVTMLPLSAGGVPPEGKDFNGIFFDITSHTLWVNAGGQYQFDAALSTAIGGYPAGMVLQNNAGTTSYVSSINNNTTDFNTTPSAIGVSWMPYSGRGFITGYINQPCTLSPGIYIIDSSGGSFTVNLPASPATGTWIELMDSGISWASNPPVLARNGNTIMGYSYDLILNIADSKFTIWYNGTTWRLI